MESIGIAIIAKDEEANLPRLLESIEGAFNRAVLLDTGSTDKTKEVFSAWAMHQTGMTFSVADWEWKNDFSDARNAADRLLLFGSTDRNGTNSAPMVDWRSWADCDDVIVGARNLRSVAENADPRVNAYFAGYNYAQDPATGQCIIYLPRERLVRSSYTHPWEGRVHEATPITTGAISQIPPELVEWVHHKQDDPERMGNSTGRNLEILLNWNDEQPGNSRVVGYIGTEMAAQGRISEAIGYFYEYLTLECHWEQERAQIRRKLAVCLMMENKYDLAIKTALEAIEDVPSWPDSYLTLAEAFLLGPENPPKSAYWAEHVLKLGRPETVLIVNPLDYDFQPKKLLSLALGKMGHIDKAIELAQEALMVNPNDDLLQVELNGWRGQAKRQRTAETYVMAAEQLVGHDEQLKALTLLEDCVPHFAMEHPAVVSKRSEVRERLFWIHDLESFSDHYEYGGSKPEDFIPDENIDPLCEYLPRTQFLRDGIQEQLEEFVDATKE